MEIFGALVLMIVMYIVIPLGICFAALVLLGGAERLLPGGMRDRAVARRDQDSAGH